MSQKRVGVGVREGEKWGGVFDLEIREQGA